MSVNKIERVKFKLNELSNDELFEVMNLIPLKIYIDRLKTFGPKTFNDLVEISKFRLDKLPKDKLFDSIIKNYKRNKSSIVQYLESTINIILVERGIIEIIGLYEKDNNLENLYEKLKVKFIENKSGIQPYLILKCVFEPIEQIPEIMMKRLSIDFDIKENEKQINIENPSDSKQPSESKVKPSADRELKKIQEENKRLLNEIENLKIEYTRELNKERAEKDKLKSRFIESITNKTLRIINVSVEDEMEPWLMKSRFNDLNELWKLLHERESELGKEIKKEDVKTLQKIMTLKYIIVTAKEME